MPSPLLKRRFKRFFDCAGTMMEAQLLKICKYTLRDLMGYILDRYSNRGFRLNVIVRAKDLAYDPPIKYFKDVLCSILDASVEAVGGFPRLETELYLDWSGARTVLKVM